MIKKKKNRNPIVRDVPVYRPDIDVLAFNCGGDRDRRPDYSELPRSGSLR